MVVRMSARQLPLVLHVPIQRLTQTTVVTTGTLRLVVTQPTEMMRGGILPQLEQALQ